MRNKSYSINNNNSNSSSSSSNFNNNNNSFNNKHFSLCKSINSKHFKLFYNTSSNKDSMDRPHLEEDLINLLLFIQWHPMVEEVSSLERMTSFINSNSSKVF